MNFDNKHLFISFIFLLVISFNQLFCQQNAVIRGRVTNGDNGEVLSYANVFVPELHIGATTDSKGFFLIASLPAGEKLSLKISYIGFADTTIVVRTLNNEITNLNIELFISEIELETVEKFGSFNKETNSANLGMESITMKELERLPKSVELDIIKSLQYIPGVQSTGDISARFYVRGSPSNQNLVLFNGSTVYNPFHGFGMFGVIDPEIVNHIDFYKGGYSAEYGERISSVLSIITKDGNKKKLTGKFGASLLSAKALVEGPIPKGSFILTARKSYSDYVMKKFLNDQNAPINFYDVSFKANYLDLYKDHTTKISFHGFLSGDRVEYRDARKEDYNWRNQVFGINWFQASKAPVFINVSYSYSSFAGEVLPNNSNVPPVNNEVVDHNFKSYITYVQDNGDELGIGFTIQEVRTNLSLENFVGAQSNLNEKGTHIDLFTKYKFQRFKFLGLDIGARFNAARILGGSEFSFEPRASLTLIPFDGVSFKSAWGVYTQEMTTLSDEDVAVAVFEPWSIIPSYLPLARATHYMTGVEVIPTDYLSFSIEAYYKKLENMPTFNDEKIYDFDPDLIAANGESYGLEFQLKSSLNRLNVNVSYTLSNSEKYLNGKTYPPRYDSRHNLNLIFDYNFGYNLYASITWTYKSGYPYTQLIGYYNKLFLDRNLSVLGMHNPFSILSDRNAARLPNYHRMDFNISKKLDVFDYKLYLDFSIINVYNRKNLFYFNRDTGERVNMLPFFPTFSVKVEL